MTEMEEDPKATATIVEFENHKEEYKEYIARSESYCDKDPNEFDRELRKEERKELKEQMKAIQRYQNRMRGKFRK